MTEHLPIRIDDTTLVKQFGSVTVTRGLDYAAEGMIPDFEWSEGGRRLRGTSYGSGRSLYQVVITFIERGNERVLQTAHCSCPVSMNCKHGVALLATALGLVEIDDEFYDDYDDDGYELFTEDDGRAIPRLAPVAALPPQWRAALGAFVTAAAIEHAPIGIQVGLRDPIHRPGGPVPVMRLVRPGKKPATWIKTGISWRTVAQPTYPNDALADIFDARHLRAVRAIARTVARQNPGDTISLDTAPAEIWDLLTAARDAGVTFLAGPDVDADKVELFRGSRVSFEVTRDVDGVRVWPSMIVDHEAVAGAQVTLLGSPIAHGGFAIGEGLLLMGPFTPPPDMGALLNLLALPEGILIPDDDVDEFAAEMLPALNAVMPVRVDDDAITPPTIEGPLPLLTIRIIGDGAQVDWKLRYLLNGKPRTFTLKEAPTATGIRDAEAETRMWEAARPAMEVVAGRCTRWQQQAARYLSQARLLGASVVDQELDILVAPDAATAAAHAGIELLAKIYTYSEIDTAVLLGELVGELGSDIVVDIIGTTPDYRPAQSDPQIEFGQDESSAGNDWLNLAITVDVDGHKVPLGEIVRDITLGATHLILPDGTYFPLNTPELTRLTELIHEAQEIGEVENGLVRRDTYHATLWEELLSLGVVDDQLADWHERLTRLANATIPAPSGPPHGLHADLRDYQSDGLDWLRFLWQNRIGGILADDMGLGKTVQALALIAEAATEEPSGCFLVIAPTSVVTNWVNEANKFVPDLTAVAVTATEAKSGISFAEQVGDATIVVTSYTLLRLQFDKINEFRWTGVIFDEAQFVKNHNSKTHQCARRLGAEMKLAITGTPMENNLMELWALLSLTAPGLFPSPKIFGEYFRKPIESGQHPQRLAQLRQRIRPVMLRRTKDQVVAELPAKQEQVVPIQLAPKHDKIYQTRLNRERQKVLGLLGDWDENRFAIFRSLTMLRQLSLHAGLVEEENRAVASAKIDYLAEQLPELIAEGHAALVFSQFTGFLGLIRERLVELGIAHSYLDGSMNAKQRARVIEEFTSGEFKVFLISLKAGGFGLNLTEADYCFVCDPWWNPAAEAQAVDRAHRIGQTRPVTVYRLVSAGTIEEKVVELQDKKRKLFDAVVDDGDLFGSVISPEDVRALLGDVPPPVG
ncbi:DEAD/DEAH box helicase [Gordonia sp. CPCC 205515]|uniref:DEAD/DEAH box helicase n=1 Tax=Gordonia sp. CPCC 205515 TaxID=3140791 RepID=UPI003AF3771F